MEHVFQAIQTSEDSKQSLFRPIMNVDFIPSFIQE